MSFVCAGATTDSHLWLLEGLVSIFMLVTGGIHVKYLWHQGSCASIVLVHVLVDLVSLRFQQVHPVHLNCSVIQTWLMKDYSSMLLPTFITKTAISYTATVCGRNCQALLGTP
jgi:hypothetical protein